MKKITCQICAREIKAKTGVIAHHGYQRPDRGSGWQTPSCMGARHLPYEQSCDQIPVVIAHIEKFIENQKEHRKNMMENPPEELHDHYAALYRREQKPYKRPDNFNAAENLDRGYPSHGYEYEHRRVINDIDYSIKHSKSDLVFLKDRLAKWVLPSPIACEKCGTSESVQTYETEVVAGEWRKLHYCKSCMDAIVEQRNVTLTK